MLNVGPDPSLHQYGIVDHFSLGIAKDERPVNALARNHCEGPNCTKTQMGRDGKIQLNLFDPDLTRVEYMEFKPPAPSAAHPYRQHPTETENR